MASKPSIDSKIAADAINQESAAGNPSSSVTNANPMLKDSKRVIKKMFVMDTSRLKGLGIESTIKNAMSKLGKEKNIKIEKPTFTSGNIQPTHTSPKVPQPIIKTEPDRNNVTVKPMARVMKQIYRPGVPFSATSNSTTDPVPIQRKSVTARPLLTHPVIHLPRQSMPGSPNTVSSFQSGNRVMAPPISVIKNVAHSTSTSNTQPIASKATAPVAKVHGPIQNNCNAKVLPSQSNSPVIKVESTAASAASDGKKIKVLSNVSLIDGKSKLLEIDKLSSKNLKFTNVIKGTDTSPPKVHQNSDSGRKPDMPAYPATVKVQIDKATKFTHVTKGPMERQPRTSVSGPVFAKGPAVPSMTRPLPTEVKLTPSVNLKQQNVHDGMHPKVIFKHGKPSGAPTMPTKIGEQKYASKNLKLSSSVDGTNQSINHPKILNFSNVAFGNAPKSDYMNHSFRSSHPVYKPIKTDVNTVSPKNVIFTNASRPPVQNITANRKSTTTPLYTISTPIKTEFEDVKPNDFHQPSSKPSNEFPLHNVAKPPICKVAKPVPSTSSTSAATEVATKQLVTTDENLEIYKPSTQKYLIKSTGSTKTTVIDVTANKRFTDAVWSTNNPRTYARHNIKRLLSDKIIKKSRPLEGNVQLDHDESTPETFFVDKMDKKDVHSDTVTVACESKSENQSTPPSNQSTPPTNQSIPHTNQSIPPTNQSTPPTKQSTPPTNQSIPHTNQSIPPTNQSTPPTKQSTPPKNQSTPPANQSIPPTNQSTPPTKQSTPPTNQSTSSTSEFAPMADPVQSPVKLPEQPLDQPMHTTTDSPKDKFVLLTTEPLQSTPTTSLSAPVDDSAVPDITPMDVDTDSDKVASVPMETESLSHQSTVSTSQVDDPVQLSIPPVDVNADSVVMSKKNFCGFSTEEVSASLSLLSQIKAILSKKRPTKTVWISANSKVANERENSIVAHDKERWLLNHETGVLEQKLDKNVTMPQKHVLPSVERQSLPNLANETREKLDIPFVQSSKDTELESGLSPSKTPVIEDADDEISDIDLMHRSKSKCSGSTMNRRAIFKSIELHRKSVLPATTDDDESELSLLVRPPRPKLRRSRQKQTLEQLKVQQNAHVSLLKRFVQTDSDCDNLNEEVLMSFIDSVDGRIEVLENQVKDCFKIKICAELNVEGISLSEQSVTSFVDRMNEIDETMKSSESVTKPELLKPSEGSSNVPSTLSNADAGSAELPELIPPSNLETSDSENRQGQLRVHQVTIQKDTFLVTEYDNQCDKINHLPLNVKLEKSPSSEPSKTVPIRKTARPTIRKKRKRKSLVEMLAKHVDKETLKSVIIEHAKQKCDSSLDSDSDSGDVVNKIFRTVCTIDLCDDDDETLHEDVVQYLRQAEEMEIEQDAMSVNPSSGAAESRSNDELPEPIESPKSSCEEPWKGKVEPKTPESMTKKPNTSSTTVIDAPIESSIDGSLECEERVPPTDEVSVVPLKQHVDPCNEEPRHSALESSIVSLSTEATSNVTLMETEPNSPTTFDDDTHMETIDTVADVEDNASPSSDNISKVAEVPSPDKCAVEALESDSNSVLKVADKRNLEEVEVIPPTDDQSKIEKVSLAAENTEDATTDPRPSNPLTKDLEQSMDGDVSVAASTDTKIDNSPKTKSPKRMMIKLRPFEDLSWRPKPKSIDNEPTAGAKLTFEEALSSVDSEIGKKSKSKRKVSKLKTVGKTEMKQSNKSTDSNQNSSRHIVITQEVPPVEQTSTSKVQHSSVIVSDDPTASPLKIKIRIGKDSREPNQSIPTNDAVNGVTKSNRSRKRKSAVLEESANVEVTPTPTETTRKRPIFDNFDSPEILTTKRARKSKSYADDDVEAESAPTPKTPPPSNTRTSKRRSNISKSSTQSDPPKLESSVQESVEEAIDQQDEPATEPVPAVKQVAEPIALPNVSVALTTPRTGRGIRPPVLPPIDVADQYVCGNCKEEVLAKDWMKHIRSHYGLAWRVDVDPPIDMDNIQTMNSRMLNFMKKANIKILTCSKCNVEKKSALGYLSHLEVCGLTPEEVKSKLVKCEYCPSMIRNCSMKIHLTFCSGLKRLMQKEKDESTKDAESVEECYNDMGRAVRRSAQKAMSSFKDLGKAPEAKLEDYVERVEKPSNKQHRRWRQKLKDGNKIECLRNGCEFTTDDLMSMVNHFNTCILIDGETFYCNRCEHGPDIRVAIEEHIKASHSLGTIESIDDKVFSDSDDDAELGEESSESEGESGDEEISEKDGDESDFDDDEDDDGWNSKGYKKRRLRDWPHNEVMLNSCLDRKVLSDYANLLKSYSGGSYYYPTLEWTQDFRDIHFSSEGLLPTATPTTFSVLSSTLTDLYLPRVQESNKFLVKDVRKYRKVFGSTEIGKSDNWKSLKRFEATIDSNCMVLFTGGPVLSMAWLPVPDDHLSQILAVCCRSEPNDNILMNNTKAVKCLIQIWNFHKLKNGQLRQAQMPHLLYSVAYDHGPIIQMEFCPSGGFTEDRLGLLAVSSYDGHVDILALPKNFTCDNSKIENLVFTIEPSMTLCCERDQPFGVLMTRLVWSQSKGHTKLAGGFANGLVAIWNLKNLETPHTCTKINGIPTLLPTDLFFAGNKAIKLLEFHHDENNEARWLIAGSHDRKVKFFDTHNVYLEISTTTAHSRITAGCWPLHWTSFLLGIDNAYSLKISGIIVKQPLDIGCRTSTYYSCIGSTCDISFNNWLNSYVFVTSYGDIHVGYVRQMISGFCETRRQRSILGYTDAVDITGSDSKKDGDDILHDEVAALDEPQPSTSAACAIEQETEVSYPLTDGIVFCDFRNPLPAVTSPSYEKIGAPPMSTYNMVKVNRIVFNPNVSAYKLYALGYESGFVRIVQLLPN